MQPMLSKEERAKILAAPRPRRLPLLAPPAPSRPELARETRDVDRACRPIYAVWEITLACDLACRHCGSRAGKARPDELSTAEAIDLVAQMAALGIREVTLIGGEVYLYPGWEAVVRTIRAERMQCTMVTGGRGMNAERARAAAEAGVQSVAVSLDGEAESHDRLRGHDGSHAAALAALDACRASGMQVAVNTQVNRLNLAELPLVFERLVAAGAHGWQIQLTVPAGRAADEPDVILQPFDLAQLFPLLAELKARADAAGIKLLAGNNVGYFGPHEADLRSHQPGAYADSCSAGRSTLGIEANGDIKGCPSLPTADWVGGNVREHRLEAIWHRAKALRHTRDRDASERWGYCAECYYGDVCRGGCTWMATSLFGRPGNNPYCHHRVLELAKKGVRERVVQEAAAPGAPFDHALWKLVEEPL